MVRMRSGKATQQNTEDEVHGSSAVDAKLSVIPKNSNETFCSLTFDYVVAL